MEVWFYHLERSSLEEVLPPLLEKCLARGWRAVVRCTEPERLDALDARLWTYRDDAFLPHGRDGAAQAARQPVLLTLEAHNPNGAQVVVLTDGAAEGASDGVHRLIRIFDGRDEAALGAARQAWKAVKARGDEASYWRQTGEGRWERQA